MSLCTESKTPAASTSAEGTGHMPAEREASTVAVVTVMGTLRAKLAKLRPGTI